MTKQNPSLTTTKVNTMIRKSPPKQTQKPTTTNNGDKPIRGNMSKQKRDRKIVAKAEASKAITLEQKYKLFVWEYLKERNGAKAYREVFGQDVKAPDVRACQLLRDHRVIELVREATEERLKEVKIDANYVLARMKEIDEMDALDILEDDGTILPIREWPKIWRQFISGFEIVEMMSGKGDDKVIAGMLKKIKWPDKTKNLELIGKHVNVQAFRDRVEHTGVGGGPIQQEIKITSVDPIEASKQYQSLIEGM